MLPSGNHQRLFIVLAVAACICAVFIARNLVQPDPRPHAADTTVADGEPESRTRTLVERRAPLQKLEPARPGKPNAGEVTTRTRTAVRPLTGFIVDDFRGWKSIPAGYAADGIEVREGAIQLSDSGTSGARSGSLVSPAIELWQPALAAPAANARALPEGSEVWTEVMLSPDGKAWGEWVALEREQAPDGRQAQPQTVATWSGQRPAPQSLQANSDETSGPFVRYRLTLTSQSTGSPVVEDLRIWRKTIE